MQLRAGSRKPHRLISGPVNNRTEKRQIRKNRLCSYAYCENSFDSGEKSFCLLVVTASKSLKSKTKIKLLLFALIAISDDSATIIDFRSLMSANEADKSDDNSAPASSNSGHELRTKNQEQNIMMTSIEGQKSTVQAKLPRKLPHSRCSRGLANWQLPSGPKAEQIGSILGASQIWVNLGSSERGNLFWCECFTCCISSVTPPAFSKFSEPKCGAPESFWCWTNPNTPRVDDRKFVSLVASRRRRRRRRRLFGWPRLA